MKIEEQNKALLMKGNAAIQASNNDEFLSLCADDTEWIFVGEQTLHGKEAVRNWMRTSYKEPPKFTVDHLIAEGEYVTAIGNIAMRNEAGAYTNYSYCDVWRFRNSKIIQLRAFVIKS